MDGKGAPVVSTIAAICGNKPGSFQMLETTRHAGSKQLQDAGNSTINAGIW